MSYTPRREDLEEPAMAAEWARVADVVLPGNREQIGELVYRGIDMGSTSPVYTLVAGGIDPRDLAAPADQAWDDGGQFRALLRDVEEQLFDVPTYGVRADRDA